MVLFLRFYFAINRLKLDNNAIIRQGQIWVVASSKYAIFHYPILVAYIVVYVAKIGGNMSLLIANRKKYCVANYCQF